MEGKKRLKNLIIENDMDYNNFEHVRVGGLEYKKLINMTQMRPDYLDDIHAINKLGSSGGFLLRSNSTKNCDFKKIESMETTVFSTGIKYILNAKS